jgi:hypothetical protein
LVLTVVAGLVGCGGGSGVAVPGQAAVAITPDQATLLTLAQQALRADVSGTSNIQVAWKVVESGGGSVTSGGTYTAPAIVGVFHVTATSVAEPTASATAELTVNAAGNPSIVLDSVPALGSSNDLFGHVTNVRPGDYHVAVFIRSATTLGWYNKPLWSTPLTLVAADGRWTCDITTGAGDEAADRIAAYLVPKNYTPPRVDNDPEIPDEVVTNSVASVTVSRP